MRTLALLATLTIVAIAFAGCSGGGGDGDSSSSSSSSSRTSTSSPATSTSHSSTATSTGSSSSTSTGSAPENHAPTGAVSASSAGGPAPFNVTFSLSGSDSDGDTLVWDLAFGDEASTNGTALPASPAHEYQAAGLYNVSFTLTDGSDPTTYNVAINVTGAAGFVPIVYEETVQVFCQHCSVVVFETGAFVPSASLGSGEQGYDAIWLEVTADMIGRPFTITSTGGDPDAVALDDCAPDATQIESYGSGPEAGFIPVGTTCLVTWDYDTPMSTITMTVS